MAAPIVHIEFSSKDFARTAAFYGGLFGWQTQQNAGASYMKFDGVDGASGGWVRADLVQSPGPVPYLSVDDLTSTIDKVEKAGGRVIVRRLPFAGGGEVALVADPDGNVIGLWMRKKGEAKADAKAEPKPEAKAEAKAAPKKEAAGPKPAKPAPKPTPPERRPAKPAKRK
ncbi:MAG TPA: VOC family protein [Polyangia bacterium]|jgi:predicted enzyme related to lactoylglutathione lyase|nr:VOC family protein [Polyangia bacterium]